MYKAISYTFSKRKSWLCCINTHLNINPYIHYFSSIMLEAIINTVESVSWFLLKETTTASPKVFVIILLLIWTPYNVRYYLTIHLNKYKIYFLNITVLFSGCFFIYWLIIGTIKSYGILYTEMVSYYGTGSGSTAWIGSLILLLMLGMCKYTGQVLEKVI